MDHSAHPRWVDEIRNFYQEFPAALRKRYYQHTSAPEHNKHEGDVPTVWKTIGDEIVFCCRVSSAEHLVCVMSAFMEALDEYGRVLEIRCKDLDVKGSGWLAAFPAPNVTVEVQAGQTSASELPDEDVELRADAEPHKFDFLGHSIDCGFRLAQFSSADKLTISVELAYALCESANSNSKPFSGKFNYIGREQLKGVIDGRPYPIVTIITERSALRREVFELERGTRGMGPSTAPVALKLFLQKFMEDEAIESPIFIEKGLDPQSAQQPTTYIKFCSSWGPIANESEKRGESEEKSATEDVEGTSDRVPDEVESAIDAFVQAVTKTRALVGGSLRQQPDKPKK